MVDKWVWGGIIDIERALQQAVSPVRSIFQSEALKPSLGRVAVSAFHNDRHGIPSDM